MFVTSLLQRHGWRADDIILIDADAGVSGARKIDEPPGLRTLFRLITEQRIGAVACQDEDRLFRDVTQIQVNIFVAACRAAGVLVITPTTVYDFAHPVNGLADAGQFRAKSDSSAAYVTSHLTGKIQPALRRLLMDGRWAGAPIPMGYMIDMRTTLPNGSPNPNWRRFAIFEPYAAVVRSWWQLFLHYDGQLRPTVRHIVQHGPYYPPPGTCAPPDGFKVVYRLRQNQGRWCTTRQNLQAMLTNPLYLGHWTVNGSIVIRDTHPPIVDAATFLQAFNRLSPVSLDGSPNPAYAPTRPTRPPMPPDQREDVYPLCPGLIVSHDDAGRGLYVRVHWIKTNNHYAYQLSSQPDDVCLWVRRASFVDAEVCAQLLRVLVTTYDFDAWHAAAQRARAQSEQEQAFKRAELAQLQTVMANLVASLGTLSHPHLIQAAEQRYAAAEAEAAPLQQDLATLAAALAHYGRAANLRLTRRELVAQWPTLPRDEQRQIIAAVLVDHGGSAFCQGSRATRLVSLHGIPGDDVCSSIVEHCTVCA